MEDATDEHQQVMTAQVAATTAQLGGPTGMANGTSCAASGAEGGDFSQDREQRDQNRDSVGSYGSLQNAESVLVSGLSGAAEDRSTRQGQSRRSVADPGFLRSTSGTVFGAGQRGEASRPLAEQPMVDDSRPGPGQPQAQGPPSTPTVRRVGRNAFSSWTANLEAAPQGLRWMSRLGEFLRNRSDLWPSPLPSPESDQPTVEAFVPARPGTPPRAATLQGFLGANMFTNNPPSSSSGIPSEVIQEEVQHQLRGVLERLDLSESRNRQLELQLEAYRQAHEQAAAASAAAAAASAQATQQPHAGPSASVIGRDQQALVEQCPAQQGILQGLIARVREASPLRDSLGLGKPQGSTSLSAPQPSVPLASSASEIPCGSNENPLRDYPSIGNPQRSTIVGSVPPAAQPASSAPGFSFYSGDQPVRDNPSIGIPKGPTLGLGSEQTSGGHRVSAEPGPSLVDALSKSVQQLQSLQAQAMSRSADSPTAQENVKPGSTTLQALPAPKDEMSSLHFQDWLEIATIAMSDLSDSSADWWSKLLDAVNAAYSRFLAATPIERLSIRPSSEGLTSGKWVRVNARACSMLLAAVDEITKQDLIARRISQDMVQSVFRLFVIFQPGGSAEKTHVLKQLQNPSQPSNLQECLGVLRSWPRWLRRCSQVGMLIPDPSVLAASLTKITSPFLAQYPDSNFRTQLLRTTLRIEASPTVEAVESYHNHLLAELEVIMSSSGVVRAKPQLNALEGSSPTASSGSPVKGNKNEAMCKYFVKSAGCRRGGKCPFSHDLTQLSREIRARKCLLCGSEAHRKKDCPTNDPGAKGSGKRDEGSVKGGTGKPGSAMDMSRLQPLQPLASPSAAVAQVDATSSESPKAILDTPSDIAPGQPMSIENLIRAAQQIVQGHSSEAAKGSGSDAASLRVMAVQDPVRGSSGEVVSATALVDTGATHPLRNAASSEEWNSARPVSVNLAGGRHVEMKMTPSSTLLLPESEAGSTTIVPVGDLVQTLGYRLDWSRSKCRLVAPDGVSMKLSMRDGCPQMPEFQALELISRLEQRKLDRLRSATAETEIIVRSAALSMDRSWFESLVGFCNGDRSAGLRAVDSAPFFQDVPPEALEGLISASDLGSGWALLKRMSCWNRHYRRRLLNSDSWIIHVFSGKGSNSAFKSLNVGNSVVIEIDILSSSYLNVENQALWDVLTWGSMNGKISAVVGGPPCKTFSRLRHRQPGPPPVRTREFPFGWNGQSGPERQEMIRDTRLSCRMIWVHSMAVAGRVACSGSKCSMDPEVAFLLEQPADPQDYMDQCDPTFNEVSSFWATSLWHLYSQEAGLIKVTFNQGAMGHVSPKPTSLGTNLMELSALEGMREKSPPPPYKGPSHVLAEWSPGMSWAIAFAVQRWLCRPRISALSRAQWQQHIKNHHIPYEKTCEVCVTSSGTGRRHVRVEHPESFVLSADVSGPLREGGLDPNGRGAHPKPHKYLLVATLRLPESYLQGYSSGKCDLAHSWSEAWVSTEPEPDDGLGLESELVPPSVEHAEDVEPEAVSLRVHPSEGPIGDEFSGELHDADHIAVEAAPLLQDPTEALTLRDDGGGVVPAVEEEHRSVRGESVVDEADLLEQGVLEAEGVEEQVSREERTDLSPPKMARMLFSIPIPDAKSATIKEALQDVLLYLRTHNVPVLRFHSDRASVFMARDTRQMLKGWGLRVTTSEGATPQTNGVAEAGVKWVKQRIRALLIGSGLPLRLWPSAADTSCVLQRAALTGMESKLAAPFGSTVHVRKRPYTGAGTTAKPDSLRSQWIKGRYLGLSSTLNSGHVIYIPPEDGQPESFIHTFHVRCLTDPGFLEEEFREHHPEPPLRRIRGKQHPAPEISSAQVISSASDPIKDLQSEVEDVLVHWNQDRALELLDRASRVLDMTDFKVGAYRHGGVTGLLKATEKYPWLTRLMVRCFTELDDDITFTAVYMSVDTERDVHVDRNNQDGSMNYVIPVAVPKSGGGVWVELRPGDRVSGSVSTRADSTGKQRFGTIRPLERGRVMRFDARRWHATESWRGRRVVLIAYTPALVHKLDQQDIKRMVRLGFPIESDLSDSEDIAVRPVLGSHLERSGGWSEVLPAGDTSYHFNVSWGIREEPSSSMAMIQVGHDGCMIGSEKHSMIPSSIGSDRCLGALNSDNESSILVDPDADVGVCAGDVFLELPSGGGRSDLAQLMMVEEEHVPLDGRLLCKAEVGYTREIERVIRNLTGPLEVVHNVDPAEVLENIQVWIPAIEKELKAVAHAVDKIPRGDERHSALLRSAKVQRLPTKLVFTVKPGDNPQPEQPESWFKRKVRLVACGNLAAASSMDTYSGTAPAEVVRIALVLAHKFGWIAGIVDIVSAFLRTPLIGDDAPQIVVHPPKVLERASLIPVGELWKLTHALYGLREAPHLWSMYRDEKLRLLIFTCDGKSLRLVQGRAEGSWWTIREEDDSVVGVVVIYVAQAAHDPIYG